MTAVVESALMTERGKVERGVGEVPLAGEPAGVVDGDTFGFAGLENAGGGSAGEDLDGLREAGGGGGGPEAGADERGV